MRKTKVKPHKRTLPSGKKVPVKGHTRMVKSPKKWSGIGNVIIITSRNGKEYEIRERTLHPEQELSGIEIIDEYGKPYYISRSGGIDDLKWGLSMSVGREEEIQRELKEAFDNLQYYSEKNKSGWMEYYQEVIDNNRIRLNELNSEIAGIEWLIENYDFDNYFKNRGYRIVRGKVVKS